MGQVVIVGLFGVVCAAIAAVPPTVAAVANRRQIETVKDNAAAAKDSAEATHSSVTERLDLAAIQIQNMQGQIGEPNGAGSLVGLLERILETQAATLQWQHDHSLDDMEQLRLLKLRITAIEQLIDARTPMFDQITDTIASLNHELTEVSTYMHTRNHDILNSLTVVRGVLDTLWLEQHPDRPLTGGAT